MVELVNHHVSWTGLAGSERLAEHFGQSMTLQQLAAILFGDPCILLCQEGLGLQDTRLVDAHTRFEIHSAAQPAEQLLLGRRHGTAWRSMSCLFMELSAKPVALRERKTRKASFDA